VSLGPGHELSHYRLVERIGEGGMGIVWRATDTTLGRDVAVKLLPDAFAGDPERMARFEREARVLASLNHPNIASIYGVGSAEGVRFLAMELVAGDDLAARVARGPVPVVESLEVARQVADALESAHEKGIVHRDLKPANVKVTPEGHVKVLDFGLAKAFEGEAATSGTSGLTHSPTITGPMTGANVILGTAAYMSPEQARGRAVDRRADIWAFGCVLFECLTGRRAFAGETVSDTLAKILEREPDLAALPRETPERVRELLRRCLVKDAKLRLRDIGDARIVLEEVLAARTPSGRLLAAEPPAGGASRRRSPLGALVAAGAVGLALGAALWFVPALRTGGGVSEPRCVTVMTPPDVDVSDAVFDPDGKALVVCGTPRDAGGSGSATTRLYARRLDGYEYQTLPGTEGAFGAGIVWHGLVSYVAPISPGAQQARVMVVPLDGSAPAISIADWKDTWTSATRLEDGDFLISDGDASFVRAPRAGGSLSPSVHMDAGRAGVSYFQFLADQQLPGSERALVNVLFYDPHGWHYSVGVLEVATGKVRVIEEDGGEATCSPSGDLLFSRGDQILAAPFDARRGEVRGPPVVVWSGLSTRFPFVPARFAVSRDGTLCYRPGQAGGGRLFARMEASGLITPWSSERFAVDAWPELSPDGTQILCSIVNARGIDEVWTSPLDHPAMRKLGSDPNADCSYPIWSPDGARIAYSRRGKEGQGLYVQDVRGGPATCVLKPEDPSVYYGPGAWLPGGDAMLATRVEGARRSIVVVPMSGAVSDPRRLRKLLPGDFSSGFPRLARDGRMLAYGSDENGAWHTYVTRLRPDGTADRGVEVAHAVPTSVYDWSPDGRTLYVEDTSHRLEKLTVSPGSPPSVSAAVEIADLDRLHVVYWCPLADGRFFAMLRNENDERPTRYNLVLGWTKLLAQKMRAANVTR